MVLAYWTFLTKTSQPFSYGDPFHRELNTLIGQGVTGNVLVNELGQLVAVKSNYSGPALGVPVQQLGPAAAPPLPYTGPAGGVQLGGAGLALLAVGAWLLLGKGR